MLRDCPMNEISEQLLFINYERKHITMQFLELNN